MQPLTLHPPVLSPTDRSTDTDTETPGATRWRWLPDGRPTATPPRRPTTPPAVRTTFDGGDDGALGGSADLVPIDRCDDEAGQATAEYALVLLGAAAIALLIVSWATKTNVVGKLLDVIFSQLLGHAGGALR